MKLKKPRFLLIYPMVVALFVIARTTSRQLNIGLVFILLGECVRCWANGYVGHQKVNQTVISRGDPKIGQLITGGPYAYVRHPLYVGSFLIGLGFCVIVGQPVFAVFALGGLLLVYWRKMAQEEDVLRHECGEEFLQYQREVPPLIPAWRRYPERRGQWHWRGIVASKEWRTLLWVVVLVIALYFRSELIQEQEPLFGEDWLKHGLLVVVLVTLMVSDGVFELVRRWKRRSVRQRPASDPRTTN